MAFQIHEELPPLEDHFIGRPVSKECAAYHAAVRANPGMWVSATLKDLNPNYGVTGKPASAGRSRIISRSIASSINLGIAPFDDGCVYEAVSQDGVIYARVLTEDMFEGVGDETQG